MLGPFLLVLIGLGVVAGFFGSLLGMGGSILLVPMLILLMGDFLPIQAAIATGLVCVIASSSSAAGVYVRRGWVDVRLGMLLELGTVAGAITGALVVTLLSATAVEVVFGIFLLGAAVLMGLRPPREAEEVADTIPDYRVRNYRLGLGICTLAGSVSGLLGIGGGPVQVPLMYLGMGVTAPLVLGVFAGAQLGSRLARRVPSRVVQALLILILLGLALLLFAEAAGYATPGRGGR